MPFPAKVLKLLTFSPQSAAVSAVSFIPQSNNPTA
jgi:hypothetical protein